MRVTVGIASFAPRRSLSFSHSVSLSLSLQFSCSLPAFPFAFGPLQTIERGPRGETDNDRLNSAIIAGEFASTRQTQTFPRCGRGMHFNLVNRLPIRSAPTFPLFIVFRRSIKTYLKLAPCTDRVLISILFNWVILSRYFCLRYIRYQKQ